jgi:hypothetical protein
MLQPTISRFDQRTSTRIRLLLLLIALGQVSKGDTIVVSVPGPVTAGFYPIFSSQAAASSWSSTLTYTDVSIAAMLSSSPRGSSGTAYLTTRIGPGTTTANEIAREDFLFPTQTGLVNLFSNLTLPSNTYYLVLGNSAPTGGGWLDAYTCNASFTMCVPPTVIEGAGVTRNEDFLAPSGEIAAYTPASGFRQGGGIRGDPFLDYSVTSIPEPSSSTLVFVGVGGVALLCSLNLRRGVRQSGTGAAGPGKTPLRGMLPRTR